LGFEGEGGMGWERREKKTGVGGLIEPRIKEEEEKVHGKQVA